MTAKPTFGLQFFPVIILTMALAIIGWFFGVQDVQVLIRQYRAQSFQKTVGQVLSAQIVSHKTSKGGVNYQPAFLYTYIVNGRRYKAGRYRYDNFYSDYDSADQIVTAHRPGYKILVYYNPADAADAVLSPGVVRGDVSLPFLGLWFFFIFLFLLLRFARAIDRPGVPPVAGGVKIITDRRTTRVRLPRCQPDVPGLITAGILSLVAFFAVVASPHAPLETGLYALAFIIIASASAYFWQFGRIASGRQDLVIDEEACRVALPLTYGRRERVEVPFSGIQSVFLVEEKPQVKGGSYTYAPTLRLRDGSTERLTIIGSITLPALPGESSRIRAESFAAWVRNKLGLPASEISSGPPDDT
jgi:hypothetical protein